MNALLDQLTAIAIAAGAEVMAVYVAGGCPAQTKGDGSPVTVADQRAEAVILAGLAKVAPDTPVVAEEEAAAGRIPRCGSSFFLVDPLDGTKEFIGRNGQFTVNIALICDHAPVAGVVYAPALRAVYAGSAGGGARMAEVTDGVPGPWRALTVRPWSDRPIDVVVSKSHMTPETRAFLERYEVGEFVSVGSSLKFCQVAEGAADLYPRLGRTMEWDTAAGDAVLRAAGGMTKTIEGEPLRYGKRNPAGDVDFVNGWFVASGADGLF